MIRIFIIIQVVCAAFIFSTCERANMYDLAKYGLPPQSAIYIFPTVQMPGNFGGRNEADNLCYQQGIAYHTLVKASTVKAFVSFSMIDELRFLVPVPYWYFPVMGISPTLTVTPMANSWVDLIGGATAPIMSSLGLAGNFWSGSNGDGSAALTENCSGWHDSTGTFSGRFGGTLIYDGTNTCNASYYILCIAY